ncbi:MAG: hypothetical protein Q4C30_00535 [Bacteroidia bacterium]|nr:hypothetical protein [Bacteroidia bacterium]
MDIIYTDEMAKIEIRHKCVMAAREAARRDNDARRTGKSVFIKRYHGRYMVIGVMVSEAQRSCRDIFADAQKLASYEIKQWNRKRHWAREAKRHKVKGAHRMAVSYFYKLLKENGEELKEELTRKRVEMVYGEEANGHLQLVERIRDEEWAEMDRESPFFYRKFRRIEEYYGVVMRWRA